jgi:hypothetical protein
MEDRWKTDGIIVGFVKEGRKGYVGMIVLLFIYNTIYLLDFTIIRTKK